jgi:adenylate kinase family enzyme
MNRFEELQEKLEKLSPIPVNMPKLYLLGDTGAGKTTIVKKILGTDDYKFPSVQQKRCTVAVTEYVLSRDLPYKATYIFRTEDQVSEFVNEILEIAIENAYVNLSKGKFHISDVVENIEETPDERFRLKYILSSEQLEEVAKAIEQMLPGLHTAIESLKTELELQSSDELGVLVDLALEKQKEELSEIKDKILAHIKCKVAELCDGFVLFSDADHYQHSSSKLGVCPSN